MTHVRIAASAKPATRRCCSSSSAVIDPRGQRACHRDRRGRSRGRPLPGVRDVVPTFRSVAVFFDPLVDRRRACCAALLERRSMRRRPGAMPGGRIEVPVAYGGEDGPDLARRRGVRRACSEAGRHRAPRGARLSRVHARLPARLRLPGHRRRVDRRAAARDAARPRAGGIGRHRRSADRHLSARVARRLADHRPHAARGVRRRSDRRRRCSRPAIASGSCRHRPRDVARRVQPAEVRTPADSAATTRRPRASRHRRRPAC